MGRSSEVLKNAGEHGPITMSYIGKLFGRVQPKEINTILLKFFENGFVLIICTCCHKVRRENTKSNAFRQI